MKDVFASLYQSEKHDEWEIPDGIGYLTRHHWFLMFTIGYDFPPGFHLFAYQWTNENGVATFAESGLCYGLLAYPILALIFGWLIAIPVAFIVMIMVNALLFFKFWNDKTVAKMRKRKK